MCSWIRHYVAEVCARPSALLVQKFIGPDMFSWIRNYVVEECALQRALPVCSMKCPQNKGESPPPAAPTKPEDKLLMTMQTSLARRSQKLCTATSMLMTS